MDSKKRSYDSPPLQVQGEGSGEDELGLKKQKTLPAQKRCSVPVSIPMSMISNRDQLDGQKKNMLGKHQLPFVPTPQREAFMLPHGSHDAPAANSTPMESPPPPPMAQIPQRPPPAMGSERRPPPPMKPIQRRPLPEIMAMDSQRRPPPRMEQIQQRPPPEIMPMDNEPWRPLSIKQIQERLPPEIMLMESERRPPAPRIEQIQQRPPPEIVAMETAPRHVTIKPPLVVKAVQTDETLTSSEFNLISYVREKKLKCFKVMSIINAHQLNETQRAKQEEEVPQPIKADNQNGDKDYSLTKLVKSLEVHSDYNKTQVLSYYRKGYKDGMQKIARDLFRIEIEPTLQVNPDGTAPAPTHETEPTLSDEFNDQVKKTAIQIVKCLRKVDSLYPGCALLSKRLSQDSIETLIEIGVRNLENSDGVNRNPKHNSTAPQEPAPTTDVPRKSQPTVHTMQLSMPSLNQQYANTNEGDYMAAMPQKMPHVAPNVMPHSMSRNNQVTRHSMATAPANNLHGSAHTYPVTQVPCHTGQAPCHAGQAPCHTGQVPCHTGQAPCHTGQAPCNTGQAPCHTGQALCYTGQVPAAQHTAVDYPSMQQQYLRLQQFQAFQAMQQQQKGSYRNTQWSDPH